MNRTSILNLLRAHKLVIAPVALALVFVLYQFTGGIVSGVRSRISAAQVEQQQRQAQAAQAQAAESLTEANERSVTRQVEDGYRERTIKPEIERTSRAVKVSRSRTGEAQTNYEAAQSSRRVDLDDRVLHGRNCASLAELYPAERFHRCE